MKKLISIFMTAILLLSFSLPCFADGDGNIDGGGGDMGEGTGTNIWHIGDDGVRVTIVNAKTQKIASTPIDFTNQSPPRNIYHCGRVSKISYRNGKHIKLQFSSPYSYSTPSTPMPQIVSPSGAVNIEAVKNYFCTAGTAKDIAEKTGFDYDKLISGDYKLLLEPIAYFTYNNITFAMTAHEASLYDQITDGDLFKQMGHLTRKNLPLAMFLETADLGFPAWSGTRNGFVSNSEIQSALGVGVVRFADTPPDGGDGDIEVPDYKYHTDIDVYTSFYIYARGGEVSPDDGGRVRINIGGKIYNQSYVCPSGDSQLIWVKWHTPKEPQTVPISISVSGGGSVKKATMKAEITNIMEVEPPDTHSTDERPNDWKVPTVPKQTESRSVNWGYWTARWHEHWVRVRKGKDKDGKPRYKWEDHGWWEYDWNSRSTNISKASLKVTPDEFCPTASKHGSRYEMKSGYGVQLEATASIVGNGEHTKAQNASATFPEFKYQTYNRLFEEKKRNTFVLKNNRYAYNPAPVHFIPLWYPDESKYEPQVEIFDLWTPGGVLNAYCSDYVDIDGDCYDDWTIGPKKNG